MVKSFLQPLQRKRSAPFERRASYASTEPQEGQSSADQLREMRASIDAARISAEAAMKAAITAERSLILDQRAWLRWHVRQPLKIFRAERHIQADVEIELENIGKTPATKMAYAAILYVVGKDEAIVTAGLRRLDEMSEAYARGPLMVTSIRPSEKPPPFRFGPNIAIDKLFPSVTGEFDLYLAVHAGYQLFNSDLAEIGALYMVNAMIPSGTPLPGGGIKGTHHIERFSLALLDSIQLCSVA